MQMKKWLVAAAVVAVSASLAFALPQDEKGWGGHRGKGAYGEKLAQKLNLTDAQKQQLRDLNAKARLAIPTQPTAEVADKPLQLQVGQLVPGVNVQPDRY